MREAPPAAPAWTPLGALRQLGPLAFAERLLRRLGERRAYRRWAAERLPLSDRSRAELAARLAALRYQPLVSLLMPSFEPDPRWLRRAVASVQDQLYGRWELVIADDASRGAAARRLLAELPWRDARVRVVWRPRRGHIAAASNTALAAARGDYVALLDQDDELGEDALARIVEALQPPDAPALLYSDEDKLDGWGRLCDAYRKPDWDPVLLEAQNFVGHLAVFSTALLREAGGFRLGFDGAQDHELLLRLSASLAPDRVRHLPHVLYHWRRGGGSTAAGSSRKPYAVAAGMRAVEAYLGRLGVGASVTTELGRYYRVCRKLPEARPALGVVAVTPVAPGLAEAAGALQMNVEPVTTPGAESHGREPADAALATRLNRAAAAVAGDWLCFLGPGCRPLGTAFAELVAEAGRPDAGVVGGRVVTPSGRVAHAGFGLDWTASTPLRPLHAGTSRFDPGPFGRALLVQSVLALSAACLLVRRRLFEELGGFDAEAFPQACYDVDLCLRAWAAGWRVVFTPHASVEATAPAAIVGAEHASGVAALRARWSARVPRDPFWPGGAEG